ncbi:hypothetical protein WS68_15505 [Burkholderia sp. TSV86]|nr:hypothetical protein WS68_15505 [Burkholderia sp. TSV86]
MACTLRRTRITKIAMMETATRKAGRIHPRRCAAAESAAKCRSRQLPARYPALGTATGATVADRTGRAARVH